MSATTGLRTTVPLPPPPLLLLSSPLGPVMMAVAVWTMIGPMLSSVPIKVFTTPAFLTGGEGMAGLVVVAEVCVSVCERVRV